MIFTDYWRVLVLSFSVMGNTVFFSAKKLMERWYLLGVLSFLWYSRTWKIWFFVQWIVEQGEVIQKVILPEVSKLHDYEPDRKQGDQTKFSQKKKKKLEKWIWYCLLCLLSHQLMGPVIEWLIHQIYKNFFHLAENFLSCNEDSRLELKKDKK